MKNIIRRIIVGIIIGLVLMCARKYLFINVHAETISISNPDYIKYKSNPTEQNYYLCGNGCTGSYTFSYFDNTYYGLASAGSDEYWYGMYYSYDNQNFPTGNYSLQFNLRMKIALRNADGVNVNVIDSAGHVYYCYTNGSGMNYLYENSLVLSNGDIFYQGNGIMGVYCPNVDLNSSLKYAINVNGNFHLSQTNSFGISKISLVKENAGVVNAITDTTSAVNNATDAVDNVNDTLNDSSTDDPSSDIEDMQDQIATNGSISQLLTLPIQLYQNILNSVSGSCSSFNLGNLLGTSLLLPCINLQQLLGSTLYGIIDILCSGLFILAFRKKMVDIFNHMTSLNDRGNELE